MTDPAVPLELPADFLARLPLIIPPGKLEGVCGTYHTRRPTTFRVNTIKATDADITARLAAEGFDLEAVAWLPGAHILRNRSQAELEATEPYINGEIYVQGLSSMVPPLVLQPREGDKICDLAAAPGSKTTQIAAMMRNTGEITANDYSKLRTFKLNANLRTLGVTNTRLHRSAGEELWRKFPETFDKVLLDAPCSLEGRFESGNPKSWHDWHLKKVRACATLQRALLRSAVSLTKPGGIIVYSTCTLSPEENEEVVEWLMHREAGTVEIESIHLPPALPTSPPLPRWDGATFHSQVERTLRLHPTEDMEAFYIARIRKKRSNQ